MFIYVGIGWREINEYYYAIVTEKYKILNFGEFLFQCIYDEYYTLLDYAMYMMFVESRLVVDKKIIFFSN